MGTVQVRKTLSDKKVRVNSSLSQDTHDKLCMLATSCGTTKTSMQEKIVKAVLNSPEWVNFFQVWYNKNGRYRVVPMKENGKITYLLP
ncbi:hypothetical protein P4647_25575 [Peribacillus frigoritolerans]|uniref:hypothetical protein n=1 Tax=Peribacillus frigoritolerans TaxID=450367 RepID=UPI002E21A6A1|nr:hypothetical protein [Peribacillus frigoritolerans]